MTKTKIEQRIDWLKKLNKNKASYKEKIYQDRGRFIDSEGHELKLKPYIRSDNNYASPSLMILDLSKLEPDKNLRLNMGGGDSASRLEARLILGKESLIASGTHRRQGNPHLDSYEVKNWELQAMLNVTLSYLPWGFHYYSFGRKEQIEKKLIIPVAYYHGHRIENEDGVEQPPIIDLSGWPREKLIDDVRAELIRNKLKRTQSN